MPFLKNCIAYMFESERFKYCVSKSIGKRADAKSCLMIKAVSAYDF